MEEKVQKRIYFADVSSGYGESKIDIPFGYEFLNIVSVASGNNYDRTVAVFIENTELIEAKESIRAEIQKSYDAKKKHDDDLMKEKIVKLDLMQDFSDIVTRFDVGDSVYYYSFNKYSGTDHSAHIKNMKLDEVVYRKTNVFITDNKTGDNLYVRGNSYGESVMSKLLFKTKEDAIEATRVRYEKDHENLIIEKEKEAKVAEEKKIKEEEEILKKAEEIKNKKP